MNLESLKYNLNRFNLLLDNRISNVNNEFKVSSGFKPCIDVNVNNSSLILKDPLSVNGSKGLEPKNGFSIVVDNSFCTIQNYDSKSKDLIRELLTYDNEEVIYSVNQLKIQIKLAVRYKKAYKINWFKAKIKALEANIRICWLKDDSFPTGHLNLVLKALSEGNISFSLNDLRIKPKKVLGLEWNGPELRYFQKEMVSLGLKNHRGVFEASVGSGKTLICQRLIYELGVPALIILPSKDLSVQTFHSFKEVLGEGSVCIVDAKTIKSCIDFPIKICTIQTLVALKKKNQLKPVLKDVGFLFADEAHHNGATSFCSLIPDFKDIYYRFGGSGTYLRNDSKTLDMYGFLSDVLYRYSAETAIKEGFLTPLEVYVHDIKGVKQNTYQREYTLNYCENENLLIKLKEVITSHINHNSQVLILVGRKDQSGKIIHEYLKEIGIPNDYVSGDSKREEVRKVLTMFNNKKIRVLIGSSIIGEGIDIRSSEHLIMLQGGKSPIQITQAIGRVVRLYPGKKVAYVHDFRFTGTKYLEKHLEQRLAIYKETFGGEQND